MSKKLFVGGLSWDTNDESLRGAFARFGDILEAKIITDRETGRSRGFGFVTLANAGEADVAVREMDGSTLDGRSIRVNEAQDRGGGPSGGGRGGFGDRDRGGGGGGGRGGFEERGGGGGRGGGGFGDRDRGGGGGGRGGRGGARW